jgi:O-antigen/teichoic acid export membrane protein
MKILWQNVVEAGAARIFSLLAGTAVVLLTARILGPERQGIIAVAIAWASLFANFAGLSLGQVAHYRIQAQKSQDWFPSIFGGLLFFAFGLTLVAQLVAYALYQLTEGELFKNISPSVLIIAFTLLPLIIWEQYSSNLLAAVGRLRQYNTAQYIGRTFWIISTVVFLVILNLGVKGALIAQALGQAIVVLIGSMALLKVAPNGLQLKKNEIKEMLKGSAKLHFNTVSAFLLAQASILMLNHFGSKTEVGWFQLAFQMVIMLLIVPQAASIVLFSRMSEVGPDKLWPEQKKLIQHVLGVILFLCVLAYFAAPILVPLAVGPEFLPTVKVFRLLLPIIIGMSLAQLMTSQWIGRGVFLPTTIATSIVAAVNIAANAILIPKYGMMGAVWAALFSYLGVAVLVQTYFAWWCEKKYKKALEERII